jgi:uncharacterized membrane protein
MIAVPAGADAAQWRICNRTAEDLYVAIAYLHTSNQWLSQGWWSLRACGGCANVMDLSNTDRVNQYFRAVTPAGVERIGGGNRFCVSSRGLGAPGAPFTGRSGPDCGKRGGGYLLAGFRLQAVEYSDRNFKTDITGTVPGKRCID